MGFAGIDRGEETVLVARLLPPLPPLAFKPGQLAVASPASATLEAGAAALSADEVDTVEEEEKMEDEEKKEDDEEVEDEGGDSENGIVRS
jgi:hypothetical protein